MLQKHTGDKASDFLLGIRKSKSGKLLGGQKNAPLDDKGEQRQADSEYQVSLLKPTRSVSHNKTEWKRGGRGKQCSQRAQRLGGGEVLRNDISNDS